jgi:hypothetical protein
MRRMDIKPLKKLRNPGRHLRSLKRWAAAADQDLPPRDELETWEGRECRVRLPFYSKLTAAAHTTPEIRREVAQTVLDAAATIRARLALSRPVRIACLIIAEDLWHAEIDLFFDDDYFETFRPPRKYSRHVNGAYTVTTWPATINLVRDWQLSVPEGFLDYGGYRMVVEEEDYPPGTTDMNHWLIAEPSMRGGRGPGG